MSSGQGFPGAIVPFRAEGSRSPLFIIHGVDGDVVRFEPLAHSLAADQPVYGIKSQALLGEGRALTRVEDLAMYYVEKLHLVQEHGPYNFLGFSFGSLVAFEMAKQLCTQGERVNMLGMLDSRPMPSFAVLRGSSETEGQVGQTAVRSTRHFRKLFARGGLVYACEKLRARSLRSIYAFLDAARRPIPRFLQRAYDINWFAAVRYAPLPYPGRIVLFQTPETISKTGSRAGKWGHLAGAGVEVREIAGGHGDVLEEPFLLPFARQLTACLEAAAEVSSDQVQAAKCPCN
jgi:thioesterase domain-containing protein